MKLRLYILLILACVLMMPVHANEATKNGLRCGQTVVVTATPDSNYHFVSWSDGVLDNPREVVMEGENMDLVAVFEPNCGSWANVPVVQLYDWILMLDMTSLEQQGYYIAASDIRWYRVVGDVDEYGAPRSNDEYVGQGYYFTPDSCLNGTGDYYAILDVSRNTGQALCDDWMRTQVVHYSSAAAEQRKEQPYKFIRNAHLYIRERERTYTVEGCKIE